MRIVNGKLKRDFGVEVQLKPEHLLCSFLNGSEKIIKQTVEEHPLHRHHESVDENGKLSMNDVEVSSAEFFIRTQNSSDMHFLKIEKIGDNQELELLKLIKLNN